MWNFVPSFANFEGVDLSWERMVQVFGDDECWISERIGWRNPIADLYYDNHFRDVAGAHCFGFSTFATEMYHGRITASEVEFPNAAYQLDQNNSYTREYLEARQGAQLGGEVVTEKISQWFGADDSGAHLRVLTDITDDLERDRLGVLCIHEETRPDGPGGHAVVPWMIRHMSDDTIRIYVYDCNDVGGVRNPSSDINNFGHYPFLELDGLNWGYQFNSTELWNDSIMYFTYSQVIGYESRYNRLGTASDAPLITDHRIPTLIDALIGLFTGDADMYFEDDAGRVTGIINDQLFDDIPGSQVLIPEKTDGKYTPLIFVLPDDISVSANIESNGENDNNGRYHLGLVSNESAFTISDKEVLGSDRDIVVVEPSSKAVKYEYALESDNCNEACTISLYETAPGAVRALDTDYIGREFILQNIDWSGAGELKMYVPRGADSLMLASDLVDVSADVVLRSTEVMDLIDDQVDYIPSSVLEDHTIGPEETGVQPLDWSGVYEKGPVKQVGASTLEDYSTASNWALEEILDAKAYGLTTDHILNNFKQNITREEFCEIVVKLYEQLSDTKAVAADLDTFSDTRNPEILKAYNHGIVYGVGGGRFAPYLPITRQEMCVMLYRTLRNTKPGSAITSPIHWDSTMLI